MFQRERPSFAAFGTRDLGEADSIEMHEAEMVKEHFVTMWAAVEGRFAGWGR